MYLKKENEESEAKIGSILKSVDDVKKRENTREHTKDSVYTALNVSFIVYKYFCCVFLLPELELTILPKKKFFIFNFHILLITFISFLILDQINKMERETKF